MADKVESEQVAAHPVIQPGVTEDEVPFSVRGDLRRSFERLKGLFTELFVEDDQSWVVGEV